VTEGEGRDAAGYTDLPTLRRERLIHAVDPPLVCG
jgi:hypothetical protein